MQEVGIGQAEEESGKFPFTVVHFRQRLQQKVEAVSSRSKSVGQN